MVDKKMSGFGRCDPAQMGNHEEHEAHEGEESVATDRLAGGEADFQRSFWARVVLIVETAVRDSFSGDVDWDGECRLRYRKGDDLRDGG